ncbi:MAG TPA: hypothetical protein VE196_12380, partial [Pseudonocardiaceae bacterium]|nr:hypothetical protein [Pseudonocardiaceae bacterium]
RRPWCEAVTLGLSAGGMILAGAALSRHPWHSVDGYAGHAPGVQLLVLISLAAVAASVTAMRDRHSDPEVGAVLGGFDLPI